MKPIIALIIIVIVIVIVIILFHCSSYRFALGEGNSMYPTFGNCTLLLIKNETNPELIKGGEMVLINISNIQKEFEFDKIAHRVVENDKESETISTRGDNDEIYQYSSQVDGVFSYDRFIGKVVYYINLPVFICKSQGDLDRI